jgi:hypothetical protein
MNSRALRRPFFLGGAVIGLQEGATRGRVLNEIGFIFLVQNTTRADGFSSMPRLIFVVALSRAALAVWKII